MSQQMMDALIKPHAGEGVALARVPVPVAGPGEVLIKIHKTAICGSDVHIYACAPTCTPRRSSKTRALCLRTNRRRGLSWR